MSFSASVPNTWAATLASLIVGWGGPREDEAAREAGLLEGETTHCECGGLKRKAATACHRCRSLDALSDNAQGMILEALHDGEPRSVVELAHMCERTVRTVWRHVRPLVESGRVRSWLDDGEVVERERAGEHLGRFQGRAWNPPKRMFRRAW